MTWRMRRKQLRIALASVLLLAATSMLGAQESALNTVRFTNETGFEIGQNVRHAKFGEGTILDCEGTGASARVQVNFGQHGAKWLILSYANLQPA